jgi:hypothetical protein
LATTTTIEEIVHHTTLIDSKDIKAAPVLFIFRERITGRQQLGPWPGGSEVVRPSLHNLNKIGRISYCYKLLLLHETNSSKEVEHHAR